MNILIVNQYAGSRLHGMEHRPYCLAKECIAHGHGVTIVAGSFSHLRRKAPEMNAPCMEESIEGIRYIWLRVPPYRGNGTARAVNMFAFVLQGFRYGRWILRGVKPDVVVASSTHPLDIFLARWLALRAGAKLIFEVHDLWPLSPIELGGMSPHHPFIRLISFAEGYAYRKSDRVISILPDAETYMRSRGLRAGKFTYIPNGVDLDSWNGQRTGLPVHHRGAVQDLRSRMRLLVGYAGAFGAANALGTLIQAARNLEGEGVGFVLVGQGPEKESLQTLASGLRNVLFLPPLAHNCIPQFLAEMDVLYIGLRNRPLFRFGVSPNKLFDYMMAAKPVIQAIDASNDIVGECDCGCSIAPEDPQALNEAVRGLLAMTPPERQAMGLRGRAYVLAHHQYPVLGQLFIQALSFTNASQAARTPASSGPAEDRKAS